MSQSIRIDTDTGLRGEIRRIAGKRTSSALNALGKISKDPDEAVHRVRKELKKLRALLRLVRAGLGESRYKKENRMFRNAARELAEIRDASVRVELVETLRESGKEVLSGDSFLRVDEKVRSLHRKAHAKGGLRRAAKEARRILKRAQKRIRKWPLDDTAGFRPLVDGVKKTYAQGREAFARCLLHPNARNLHEWRKECKYLRYQLGFLKEAAPEKIKPMVTRLHELADRLGEDHDQAMLAETLEPLAGKGMELGRLVAIHAHLEERHRKLMDHCLVAGRIFFATSPGEFAERIEGWWEDARTRRAS